MMLDEERVVHQGLGWFLREAWKRDPEGVEPFLLEFKDSAARLNLRVRDREDDSHGEGAVQSRASSPRFTRSEALGLPRVPTSARPRRLDRSGCEPYISPRPHQSPHVEADRVILSGELL